MNNINFIKSVVFLSITILIMGLEFLFPRKERVKKRSVRWLNNLLIVLFNRFVTPLFYMIPIFLMERPFPGLLEIIPMPGYISFFLGFIVLDIVIYWQHRMFHVVEPFWRLHSMHHTDRDLDFTSALRFHPLEIFISMLIKLLAVWVFGIDPFTLVIFEISINTFAIFNHGNFYINDKLEYVFRLFIITPDIHRIHHSVIYRECNSNYGTIFIFWDRIFRSLNVTAERGQDGMVIGIPGFKDNKFQHFHWMLVTPLFKKGDKDV